VTDRDGRFSATALWGAWRPAERREVLVYKPGYQPWRASTKETWAPLFAQEEVALVKMRSRQEARAYRTAQDLGVDVCARDHHPACIRPARVPGLVRAVAIHQKIYRPAPWGLEGAR
jgi:hypothetical protein